MNQKLSQQKTPKFAILKTSNYSSFLRRQEPIWMFAIEKEPSVYMLASQRNGTLYTGVTSDLGQRVWEHKEGILEGFTKTYNVKTLVWYEEHDCMEAAILREKRIKKWKRDWKVHLIMRDNPEWLDLYDQIF